jgi:hypothetical protein
VIATAPARRIQRAPSHVAIKVLPASVAADPERLTRFEREANAVSALNQSYVYQFIRSLNDLFLARDLPGSFGR